MGTEPDLWKTSRCKDYSIRKASTFSEQIVSESHQRPSMQRRVFHRDLLPKWENHIALFAHIWRYCLLWIQSMPKSRLLKMPTLDLWSQKLYVQIPEWNQLRVYVSFLLFLKDKSLMLKIRFETAVYHGLSKVHCSCSPDHTFFQPVWIRNSLFEKRLLEYFLPQSLPSKFYHL